MTQRHTTATPGRLFILSLINLVLIVLVIALIPDDDPFAPEHLISTVLFILLIITLLVHVIITFIITAIYARSLITQLYTAQYQKTQHSQHGGTTDYESDQSDE